MFVAKGFTFIELVIALAIVSGLSAIAVPIYQDHSEKVRMADMQRYALLLTMDQDAYYKENGRFYGMNTAERQTIDVEGAAD